MASPAPEQQWQKFDEEPKPDNKSIWGDVVEFLGPQRDHYRQYFFGLIFDLVGLLVVVILILTLLEGEEIADAWYMPLLGIVASTISMATPAGGGIVYFPVLTLLKISTEKAIAFSLASQFVGSGIFGTVNWMRKSWSSIVLWLAGLVSVVGSGASVISSLYFPQDQKFAPRLTFSIFSLFLAVYIIYGLKKGELSNQSGQVPFTWKSVLLLAVTSFVGGLLVGYISVGIDTIFFFIVCSVYQMDSRVATVNSVLIIGWTSFVPFMIRLIKYDYVPLNLWLMNIVGVVFGARIGPIINKKVGRRRMLIFFVILLLLEVIRTFIELFIIPLAEGDDILQ